jgi:hypothetical protein
MEITPNSIVVATPAQVSCVVGAEAVILHVNNGLYYALDDVGTAIWNVIQQPHHVLEVRDSILRHYDVSPEQCELDLLALLHKLLEQGLIEVRPDGKDS